MWWVRELLASLRFLAIQGSQPFFKSKRIYELFLPFCAAAVVFLLFLKYPLAFDPDFLKKISANIFQFMVFVVPFHLAALGAFATFERAGLDEPLSGTNAEIRVWNNRENGYFYETLTLRQYASLLFGYLCTIGMIFIIFYITLDNVNVAFIAGNHIDAVKRVALAGVLFFIAHYGCLSVYAITFLFEKINKIGAAK
ncbi:hypothetical protein [Mesorhizobium sp.]|uniref:hypothetical protein n=1 Tax=Mesorhizobium sp. TaxID=1871066 RepID=UPI000FE68BCF|nr:hypothetical protein [Mesorhizobium sp.]RWG02557.1 MAG: hypothetical protein EOQ54_19580 [Mesorhizobium sp.]RWH00812.1 MAG: hypothetical protein EOQ72_09440 [Mesorhizobium sp.]TIN43525.1 MAG: hypothetical protein E5Y25_16190 [Mesorhizobium sp.]TIR89866.1 MAG: hypothetical protein E5X08_25815 [Mesorhizobium sp.]